MIPDLLATKLNNASPEVYYVRMLAGVRAGQFDSGLAKTYMNDSMYD